MNIGESARKSATTKNQDTADIKKLLGEMSQMRHDLTLLRESMEETESRSDDAHQAVRTILTDGVHIHDLITVEKHLKVIRDQLEKANIGPDAARVQEMIAPTITIAKRIATQTSNALMVSSWQMQRIALATALAMVTLQALGAFLAHKIGSL